MGTSIKQASKWADIIGAVAVVIGLVFVGLEIRQNTRAQQFSTTQALVSEYNAAIRSMVEESNACLISRGFENFGDLDGTEALQFSIHMLQSLRVTEQMYYAWLEHEMDPEVFSGFAGQVRTNMTLPGLREYFQLRRDWFGEQFQAYIDNIIQETDPITNYYGFASREP